jgi:membrane peptidoglycan carboxypeptidase
MKKIKKIIFLMLIVIIVIGVFFVKQGYELYLEAINQMGIEDKIAELKNNENYTKYDELPQDYINAVVAVEDKRFFTHSGVDIVSILRAIAIDIKEMSFKEGGSTITQQLAKNVYFTQEKKITRKIAEIFMALEFENSCSKEEIFELYVNTSYFGDGYYCVKEASLGYFDKLPIDMNLYECTLLAGIPNAPSVYAPTKNPELARQRQGQVVRKMLKQGYLSTEEASKIILVNE